MHVFSTLCWILLCMVLCTNDLWKNENDYIHDMECHITCKSKHLTMVEVILFLQHAAPDKLPDLDSRVPNVIICYVHNWLYCPVLYLGPSIINSSALCGQLTQSQNLRHNDTCMTKRIRATQSCFLISYSLNAVQCLGMWQQWSMEIWSLWCEVGT